MAAKINIPNLPFIKYSLNNGLEVILLEDHRLPLVAVNIWYHAGPANERPGRTGFAHLFEHMMFEGSKHVGEKAHFKYLESAGASEINGTTDFDRTNYFETLPSNQLELALWLESDRMGFLLDGLDEEKLTNQKDVVRNERRQNIESTPYGIVREEIFHQLFPKNHPYHGTIMGSHADIEAAELTEVRDFFRTYYAPNNASLAIVGDIDPERTKGLVEKYFGPIPPGSPPSELKSSTPPITSEKRIVVTDQIELPRVYMVWITDPLFTQGDAEFDLIAKILGGGKSSRLYRTLVYERRMAQNVGAHQTSLALGSVFHIEATCKPNIPPEDLEDAIRQELELFRENGPDPDEIESARNVFESAVIRGLETLGGFGGVADRLNLYNHSFGDPGYLEKDLERYYVATPDSLRNASRSFLKRESGIVIYGVPGKKVLADVPKSSPPAEAGQHETSSIPGQDWRNIPPSPAPMPSMTLPAPRSFRLQNGLQVLFLERRNLPVVSTNILVMSGSERNPSAIPGLASFTAGMLDEGTDRLTALEIAAAKDRIGASMHTGSTMDMSYIAMWALKKNLDTALELVSDCLLHPTFPQKEIERIRNDRLTHILQQKDNPGAIAAKVFSSALYGSDHPYGYMEIGTEQSNRFITRDRMVDFYQSGYTPDNAALVIAGDISESEIRPLAEKYFGNWDGKHLAFAETENAAIQSPKIILVHKPESSQTVLRIGHVGLSRIDPDYVPVEILNMILGGLFSSRINQNLRERNGYTYGAYSSFQFRRGRGPFVVAASVHSDATAPAVREVFREMERIQKDLVTSGELSAAKDSIVHSLPGLFETTYDTTSSIGQLFVYSLPHTHFHDLPEMIQAITIEDVQAMAMKHLKPEEAVVIAVGDCDRIEKELEKIDLGPIEKRDESGNPM